MTRYFDPTATSNVEVREFRRGDAAPAGGYVYDAEGRIALAIEVALVTGRPLLVRGKPGTGKTSLARDVAKRLNRRFYRHTVTSRTRARDLLWTFDAVRRLNDANSGGADPPLSYVLPGVLWWAFDAASAASRGGSGLAALRDPAEGEGPRAVVLVDEIDKADPDLPNDLLIPLGALEFQVTELEGGLPVTAKAAPLILITTNEERDLPEAFVRRCVVLGLPDAGDARMLEVARSHFGEHASEARLQAVLAAYKQVRAARAPDDHEPSLAEFLDAVAAVIELGAESEVDARWREIVAYTLAKPAPK